MMARFFPLVVLSRWLEKTRRECSIFATRDLIYRSFDSLVTRKKSEHSDEASSQ